MLLEQSPQRAVDPILTDVCSGDERVFPSWGAT